MVPSGSARASTIRRGLRDDRGARGSRDGGRQARRHLPQPRPVSAGRPVPRPVPGGDRDRPAQRARRPTSPTSTIARRSRAPRISCSLSSTTRGRAGQDVTFDAYPSEWACTRLLILIPTWVQAGGPATTKERLADKAVRERIRDDLTKRGQLFAGPGGLRDVRIGNLSSAENRRWEGRPFGELIDDRGDDPVDVLCDLLLAENLRPSEVTPGPHIDGIRRFLRHPIGMVGTDSTFLGAKPARGPTAASRGSSASSSATRACSRSRMPSEDDVGARGAARAARPRRHPRRGGGRPRRLRSGDGPVRRDGRRPAPETRRDRAGSSWPARWWSPTASIPARTPGRALLAARGQGQRRERADERSSPTRRRTRQAARGGSPSRRRRPVVAAPRTDAARLRPARPRPARSAPISGPADGEPQRDRACGKPHVARRADAFDVVDRPDLVGLGQEGGEPGRPETRDLIGLAGRIGAS